jgi:SAM-dependent methyltransferase
MRADAVSPRLRPSATMTPDPDVTPPVVLRSANAGPYFWDRYQPGFRASDAPIGSPAWFAEVERRRYELEPAIPEMARFADWSGRDVLEAGCGVGTDGVQFARAGARYTGLDLSDTALTLARLRFAAEGLEAELRRASITELPFPDASFDLVYSNGVIHHEADTERAVAEFHRVLRPGGQAIVMVYHRNSLNYAVNIMVVRRVLVPLLEVPGAVRAMSRITGEREDVLQGHADLLARHGLRYVRDKQLFLSNNTDGPGNALSKVYSASEARALFKAFDAVSTRSRFLNLRAYPGGERLGATPLAERAARRWGWHLWIHAVKR